MKKVLMVCLGNICRSPLAEGVLRKLAKEKGVEMVVDSCGTAAFHIGEQPDHRSIAIAAKHDIDISDLRARPFHTSDFHNFDKIFVMDTQNYKDIVAKASTREDLEKVQLIMSLLYPKEKVNVPDPYYRDLDAFEEVYQMLHSACSAFLEKVPVNEG